MRIKKSFLSMLLLSMAMMPLYVPAAPAHAKPPLNKAIIRQQHRNEYVKFESVIEALDVKPGMSILDIGAGPGYASFLFAEKLGGTGAVYATDIREDFVKHISGEAKRRGLANLHSAVVKGKGLDEFYGMHRYDLVFLSNVYHCLDRRIEYFTELRGLLNRNARLVLVLYNQVPLFSVDDLHDADGIIETLSAADDDDPFKKYLSAATKRLFAEKGSNEALEQSIVDDFNRMVSDPGFYKEFYHDSYFRKDLFTAPERDFANWLLMTLEEDGVLGKAAGQIDARAARAVIRLNRLFFAKRFGEYLAKDGAGAYIPAGDANRHTSKFTMLRELDVAGYALKREISLSPYFDAFIMVPKDRRDQLP